MTDNEFDTDGSVDTKSRQQVQRPRKYKVLLHNDHYTSMEFVVEILTRIFRKSEPESVEIMLHVHERGVGIAGVYPYAVAETKVENVHQSAEANGFPLKCSMEPE